MMEAVLRGGTVFTRRAVFRRALYAQEHLNDRNNALRAVKHLVRTRPCSSSKSLVWCCADLMHLSNMMLHGSNMGQGTERPNPL